MRVMKIANTAIGVTPNQEARWPGLASAAVEEVLEGKRQLPTVWFRTDAGAVGSVPVTEPSCVTFDDDDEPTNFLGAMTHFGPEARSTD